MLNPFALNIMHVNGWHSVRRNVLVIGRTSADCTCMLYFKGRLPLQETHDHLVLHLYTSHFTLDIQSPTRHQTSARTCAFAAMRRVGCHPKLSVSEAASCTMFDSIYVWSGLDTESHFPFHNAIRSSGEQVLWHIHVCRGAHAFNIRSKCVPSTTIYDQIRSGIHNSSPKTVQHTTCEPWFWIAWVWDTYMYGIRTCVQVCITYMWLWAALACTMSITRSRLGTSISLQ